MTDPSFPSISQECQFKQSIFLMHPDFTVCAKAFYGIRNGSGDFAIHLLNLSSSRPRTLFCAVGLRYIIQPVPKGSESSQKAHEQAARLPSEMINRSSNKKCAHPNANSLITITKYHPHSRAVSICISTFANLFNSCYLSINLR